jgi:hypothetical protein
MHGLRLEQRADGPQRVRQVAVLLAVDCGGAALRPVKAEDQPHGGGLAGAVRPEEAGDRARLDSEGQMVDCQLVPVALGEVVRLDHLPALPVVRV